MLDITDDDIRMKFLNGVRNVASVSLAIGYPTVASVPHSIINGFKNLLAIAAETDITFPEAEKVKSLKVKSRYYRIVFISSAWCHFLWLPFQTNDKVNVK